jgi:hypothetical protein
MTPPSEFLFRLPSQPFIPKPMPVAEPLISLDVSVPIMQGIFTASTWSVLNDKFHSSFDPTMLHTDVVLELPDLPRWVVSTRAHHWCVGIKDPGHNGGLAALEWLRSLSNEFMFGGIVASNGRWCLYIRGTLDSNWIGPDAQPLDVPDALNDNNVPEYLRIGVVEGTTMLSQLHYG